MDRRLNAVRKIEYGFTFIVTRIKLANKLNFTDVNLIAEDFFKLLFNQLYDFDLKNANTKRQNETAIDLYYTKERIAFQVTSQNRTTKISSTVDDFIRTEKYKSYSTFIIFSITAESKCSSASMEKLSEFNVEFKYINVTDLQSEILREFDTEKLESIAEFLEYQISIDKQEKKKEPGWVDEKLKTLHIVDQIDVVLNYFDGFNLIYPRTLSRIYPFNLDKKVYDAYSNRCLKTNNIEIHELLQKVKINDKKELEIADDSLLQYHDKLKIIFEKLNNSLVDCICYRENYTEIEHHKISIKHYVSDCNCNQCKYQKFKTKELFSELKTKSIVHSDDLSDALNEGYYFCKLGEHIKGWQIFDSVALKSLQQKKPIVYFLAQHNNLAICNFIDSPWWENEAKAILPKLEQVNLHNILCQTNSPAIIIDELIKVKEDYHLNYSRERIEEYVDRTKEINILYSNKGYSSSYPTIELLKHEIHLLFAFYTSNSIISDDFSTFQQTIAKGIDGIMYSYTTDSRYEYRYKKFDWFIFTMMLFYVDEALMEELFEKHKIDLLEINEIDKQKIVDSVINFFNSQYTHFGFGGPDFAEDIKRQEYFSHYRQLLRHLFNRLMLLLSRMDLSYESSKAIIPFLIDFLKASEDINHSSWSRITKYISKSIESFSDKQIETIIELCLDSKNHRNGEDSLESICDIASASGKFTISDSQFFNKILNIISTPCHSCNRIHNSRHILSLWNIASSELKPKVKEKVVKYLEDKFDGELYQRAVYKGILSRVQDSTLYLKFIEYAQNSCHPFDLKKEGSHWLMQSYSGFNCINCLAYMDSDFSDSKIQEIAMKSDYYNWLINHEKYDYTNFDYTWITDVCPYNILCKLSNVITVRNGIKKVLLKKFNKKLAKIYVKHFLKICD